MSFKEFWNRIRFLLNRRRMDTELAEEMRQHLELKAGKNIEAGMGLNQARDAAQRQLGNFTRQQENSRASWGFPLLESIVQDIRYALRGLRRSPGFTTVAMLTLAIGIGSVTSIFTIVNTVLLQPLPYDGADRLIQIASLHKSTPDIEFGQSASDVETMQKAARSFDLAAYGRESANLTGQGEPERATVSTVSPELFPMLGARPLLGRSFSSYNTNERDDLVVLSEGLWHRKFASNPGVIGNTITLDQKKFVVVGVLPAWFDFPSRTQIWRTIPVGKGIQGFGGFTIGKLKPGVSLQQAQAELDIIAPLLAKADPDENAGLSLKAGYLQAAITGGVKTGLLVLLGAVGLVLLIACANVSNLILSRSLQRRREIAMRAALGASRSRIIRQLLIESFALSALGGSAGLLLATAGVQLLRAYAPAGTPRVEELHVDPMIALFAVGFAMLAGALSGLAPALHVSRPDPNAALKEHSATVSPAGFFSLRSIFVIAEIAMALVLVTGSTLMLQSLYRMLNVNTGMRTDHLLSLELNLPQTRYADQKDWSLFQQNLLASAKTLHGVVSVAVLDSSLLSDSMNVTFLPRTANLGGLRLVQNKSVTPGYFSMIGIPLSSGRFFNEGDREGSAQVAIINQAMARQLGNNTPILGRTLRLGKEDKDQVQVMGVVKDARDLSVRSAPRPEIYFPFSQSPSSSIHLLIRTSSDPLDVAADVKSVVQSLDKDLPITRLETMADIVSGSVAEPRFRTFLLGSFAGIGLLLTLIGIYGVISYSVGQRTREIGVRMALGAQRENVLKMVLQQGLWLTFVGLALGIAGSLAATRVLTNELFNVKPQDPFTLVGAAALMLVVGLAATYVPARRATQVDPMVALRYE